MCRKKQKKTNNTHRNQLLYRMNDTFQTQTDFTVMMMPVAIMTGYLWPIVVEMIKTAIENEQHLTVEGIYIPCDWKKDFPPAYAKSIRAFFLVMSETYIRTHFDTIRIHADAMEKRKFPQDLTMEKLMDDNLAIKKACDQADQDIVWIDEEYPEITL